MTTTHLHTTDRLRTDNPLCPFSLRLDPIARMLNFELADDPVYDGLELQWFDDDLHGAGMLAFLARRENRRVDYYLQPGLHVDRFGYEIGGGTGSWTQTNFDVARLEVDQDGVHAEARFTDVDGRTIEIRVDDRDGHRRRRAGLLAPVSAGIDRPTSLLLVWLPAFDLVRVTGEAPMVRIGGRDAATGRLPGRWLHRRHLIKYAAPVCAVELNRNHDGPIPAEPQHLALTVERSQITAITTEQAGHRPRSSSTPRYPTCAPSRTARSRKATGTSRLTMSDSPAGRGRQSATTNELRSAWMY